MKRTFARVLSLVLVLVLLISAVPFALADSATEIQVGSTTTITVEVSEGKDPTKIVWSSTDDTVASVSGDGTATGTVTGHKGGSVIISASIPAADQSADAENLGSYSVKVLQDTTSISVSPETAEVSVGEPVQLNAKLSEGANVSVAWKSDNNDVATVDANGLVTAHKEGKAVITASASGKNATCTVTVSKKALTPSVSPTMTLNVGNTSPLTVDGLPEDSNDYSITWNVNDAGEEVVSCVDGTVTALKAGTAQITGTVQLTTSGSEKYTLASDAANLTVTVTVKSSGVNANNISILAGSSGSVKLSVSDTAATNVTYEVKDADGLPYKVSGDTVIFSPAEKASEGTYQVTYVAKYKLNNVDVTAEGTAYVYVYHDDHTVVLNVTGSFNTAKTANVSSVVYDGKPYTNETLNGILGDGAVAEVKLGSSFFGDKTVGTFAKTNWSILEGVNCTINHSGEMYCSYELYSTDRLVVSAGYLYINATGADADITFKTTYNKSITFDENEFVDFWNRNKSANKFSSSLSYVTFDIQGGAYPQKGALKYDGKSFAYNTKFKPNYSASNTGYSDLDKVEYVPDSSVKSTYTVTIPFTAYGTTSSEKMTGTVAIVLNETSLTISTYGVKFGTGTTSVVDLMEDAYNGLTGAYLGYVKFPNMAASVGKLRYNFTTLLNSNPVLSSYEFYLKPTSAQKDLNQVVFVPRAGLTGDITITFIGYDTKGDNERTCTITLNVEGKTKSDKFSDVTASSYSWAADSVDFLYYEEVANGSNGKYNPKSNITRGDFMLMLYRAFLEEKYGNYNVTSNFPDVVKGTTSYSKETYQAVGVAKYLGIAQGSNGKYNPTSYITRQEAMTLIYRTLDEVGYSMSYTVSTSTSSFSDYSSVSSYAKAAIKDLIGHGVVIGTNGKIQPKSNITRAEMAVILHRVLTY